MLINLFCSLISALSVPFIECLIELEPMLRRFNEIDVLEAVLEVKRTKVSL